MTFSPEMQAAIDGIDQDKPYGAGVERGAQNSVEWLMERVGHATASKFKDILGTKAKREKYLMDVIVERLTGKPVQHFVTRAMEAGTEREPAAKMAYEKAMGCIITETGFIHHPTLEFVGGSPDAVLGDDGALECKAPTPGTHIDLLLTGDVAEYKAQCQGILWVTGRKWIDLVSYCPDLPDPYQLFIRRLERDDAYIKTLEIAVAEFLAQVQFTLNALAKARGSQ